MYSQPMAGFCWNMSSLLEYFEFCWNILSEVIAPNSIAVMFLLQFYKHVYFEAV